MRMPRFRWAVILLSTAGVYGVIGELTPDGFWPGSVIRIAAAAALAVIVVLTLASVYREGARSGTLTIQGGKVEFTELAPKAPLRAEILRQQTDAIERANGRRIPPEIPYVIAGLNAKTFNDPHLMNPERVIMQAVGAFKTVSGSAPALLILLVADEHGAVVRARVEDLFTEGAQ